MLPIRIVVSFGLVATCGRADDVVDAAPPDATAPSDAGSSDVMDSARADVQDRSPSSSPTPNLALAAVMVCGRPLGFGARTFAT